MKTLPVSHGAVELALLPLATAGFAIIRANEAPSLTFWISSLIGSLSVIIYAMHLGFGQLHYADLALLDDCFCSALLNESITFFTIVTAVVVVIAVIVGKNTGVTKKSSASIKQSR